MSSSRYTIKTCFNTYSCNNKEQILVSEKYLECDITSYRSTTKNSIQIIQSRAVSVFFQFRCHSGDVIL